MPILNYTTKISAAQTVGEIQAMLAKAGANGVRIEYENRKPVAIEFETDTLTLGKQFYFWNVNVDNVLKSMQEDAKVPHSHCTREQAERVAWRIEKDWLEAQLAKIFVLRLPLEKVMLPYMISNEGKSLYEVVVGQHQKALPAPR